MKTLIKILLGLALVYVSSCISARIIKQTESDVIIQGYGASKIEARMSAEEKAKTIFPNYVLKKDPDCSQEYSIEGSEGKASGNTYWGCVIEAQKK